MSNWHARLMQNTETAAFLLKQRRFKICSNPKLCRFYQKKISDSIVKFAHYIKSHKHFLGPNEKKALLLSKWVMELEHLIKATYGIYKCQLILNVFTLFFAITGIWTEAIVIIVFVSLEECKTHQWVTRLSTIK